MLYPGNGLEQGPQKVAIAHTSVSIIEDTISVARFELLGSALAKRKPQLQLDKYGISNKRRQHVHHRFHCKIAGGTSRYKSNANILIMIKKIKSLPRISLLMLTFRRQMLTSRKQNN